ncbi:MAG: sensor histidine kinase, partial [Thermoplasmata archaeon]
KVEAGRMDLAPSPFALEEALRKVGSSLWPQLHDRALTLHIDVAPELDEVTVDPLRFKQVLINLLSNAIKFSPSGGHIEISAELSGESDYSLKIRDGGIGVAEDDQSRIFTEFEQLNGGPGGQVGGTGLGLSITRKFVLLMGGAIEVQSEVGHGSTFTVILPRVPRGSPPAGASMGRPSEASVSTPAVPESSATPRWSTLGVPSDRSPALPGAFPHPPTGFIERPAMALTPTDLAGGTPSGPTRRPRPPPTGVPR